MKRIKHYLEDTITNMLFDSVFAFWEQPISRQAYKEEMHILLKSVEEKLSSRIKSDERFVNE